MRPQTAPLALVILAALSATGVAAEVEPRREPPATTSPPAAPARPGDVIKPAPDIDPRIVKPAPEIDPKFMPAIPPPNLGTK